MGMYSTSKNPTQKCPAVLVQLIPDVVKLAVRLAMTEVDSPNLYFDGPRKWEHLWHDGVSEEQCFHPL